MHRPSRRAVVSTLVTASMLLATACETEGGAQEAATSIVANAPAGSALLTPDAGHGYVLLNDPEGAVLPLAADLLRWIKQNA